MHGQDAFGPEANGIKAINLKPMRGQRIEPPYGLHGPGVFQVTGSNPTPDRGQHLHPGQGPVYWQDAFYLFLGEVGVISSTVYRYRKGDSQVTTVGTIGALIIVAGVACAND